MEKEKVFKKLWDILAQKQETKIEGKSLLYDTEPVTIELTEDGEFYQFEIHLGCDTGFGTSSISAIIDPEDYEYRWFWHYLNELGISEDDLLKE